MAVFDVECPHCGKPVEIGIAAIPPVEEDEVDPKLQRLIKRFGRETAETAWQFLQERCIEGKGEYVSISKLYDAYTDFAHRMHANPAEWSAFLEIANTKFKKCKSTRYTSAGREVPCLEDMRLLPTL